MPTYMVASANHRKRWVTIEAQSAARACGAYVRAAHLEGKEASRSLLCIHVPGDRRKCRTHLMVPEDGVNTFGRWVSLGDLVANLTLAFDLPAAARHQPAPVTSAFSAVSEEPSNGLAEPEEEAQE